MFGWKWRLNSSTPWLQSWRGSCTTSRFSKSPQTRLWWRKTRPSWQRFLMCTRLGCPSPNTWLVTLSPWLICTTFLTFRACWGQASRRSSSVVHTSMPGWPTSPRGRLGKRSLPCKAENGAYIVSYCSRDTSFLFILNNPVFKRELMCLCFTLSIFYWRLVDDVFWVGLLLCSCLQIHQFECSMFVLLFISEI